jgi:hypothetical protein
MRGDRTVLRGHVSGPIAYRQTNLKIGRRREIHSLSARAARSAGIDSVVADVRYAVRALRRSPSFTIVAVMTLALGIGANTAIFSVVNGVILRPLSYPEPERLVSVASVINGASVAVSPLDFMDWRRDARSFVGLAASASSETILTGSGRAERLSQARVTANAFDVLSVRPLIGRAFVRGEEAVSAPRVAMLSEGFWQRRFGADSSVVGRSLLFDGFATTIVGIAPASMRWPGPVDVWMTTRFSQSDLAPSGRGARSVTVIGRLAPNASIEPAQREMNAIARRLEQLDATRNANVGTRVTSLLANRWEAYVRRCSCCLAPSDSCSSSRAATSVAWRWAALRRAMPSWRCAPRSASGNCRGRTRHESARSSSRRRCWSDSDGFPVSPLPTCPSVSH